jgi:TetR/AcrR family transcriptional repressor of mexJK operon
LALREEALSIIRLFLAEAPRVSDFARRLAESFPRLGFSELARFMTVYAERGALTIDDPQLAAQHFAMMVIGVPQRLAMLGHRDSKDEEERRVRSAVKLFLDGCRRKS